MNRVFDLLPGNKTNNSEVYCHQLDKLNDSRPQKKPEFINRKGVGFPKIMRDLIPYFERLDEKMDNQNGQPKQ